jgi:hypothetical protein
MPEDIIQPEIDTQTAPEATSEAQTPSAETQQPNAETTSGATDQKPEFSDANMQKRFTERMTELKQKEDLYTSGLQKAETYDKLVKDPEFLKWYSGKLEAQQKQKEPDAIPQLSDEEWAQAVTDKNEFQKVVLNQARSMVQREVMPVLQELQQKATVSALERDIDTFADAVGDDGKPMHADFDDLLESGKIQPFIQALQGTKMSGVEIVDAAYKLATYEAAKNNATEKAHNIVATKKAAIGDRGTVSNVSPDDKKLSIREFMRKEATRLGIPVP